MRKPWGERKYGLTFLYLLCFVQFGALLYDPLDQIPTATDKREGYGLETRISTLPGEVWAPCQGYLAARAGKQEFAHQAPMWDIFRCGDEETRTLLEEQVKEALRAKRFSAILLDSELLQLPWFERELVRSYEAKRRVFSDEDVFWPVTGRKGRPEVFYVPKVSLDPDRSSRPW